MQTSPAQITEHMLEQSYVIELMTLYSIQLRFPTQSRKPKEPMRHL